MAKKQAPAALDLTGTVAAFYPSEEQLWVQGPPINDPLDQNVFPIIPEGVGGAVAEDINHGQMNGETPNDTYYQDVVNLEVYGPQGFGDWNVQAFQTGHTQNVILDPAAEQGWGTGPARKWAHFPKVEGVNPDRNMGQHFRNGQLPIVAGETALWDRGLFGWEAQFVPYKHVQPVAPVVPLPVSVPFSATVPTYAGGPVHIPGVDVPIGDEGIWG